jgi:hypothetical protein
VQRQEPVTARTLPATLALAALSSLVCALSASACSGARAPAPSPPLLVATALAPDAGAPSAAPSDDSTAPLGSVLIDSVPEGTYGPYVGARDDGRALAIWAAHERESGRRWVSVALDPRGAPLQRPRAVSDAPQRLGLVALRPTALGFVVLSTAPGPAGTGIDALLLGASGELGAASQRLGHVHEDVLWLDAITIGETTSVLWATRAAGSASLQLAPLAAPGKPQHEAVTLVEGALAWQALELADGVALACAFGKDAPAPGVRVLFFDGEGKKLAETPVTSSARVQADLDAALIQDQLVLVWSEQDGLEPALIGAAIGPDEQLVAKPRALLEPGSAQRLERLVPPLDDAGTGYLVWELGDQSRPGARELTIAPLSGGAELGSERAQLRFDGEGSAGLELAASARGLAALTRAPACAKPTPDCSRPAAPTFVEWSSALELTTSVPLRLGAAGGASADLAWALRCSREGCSALAAASRSPVPLYGVELRSRSEPRREPVGSEPVVAGPTLDRSRSVFEDELLAALTTTPVGARSLVAWVTAFDPSTPYVRPEEPAPDGRMEPVRALLRVAAVGAAEVRTLEPETISYRAHSPGGVALASLPGETRALLAWTALDDGEPQVFATQLDARGKRLAQRMLTHGKGAIEQVRAAALRAGGGYVVAWLGEREGQRRVLLSPLRPSLRPRGPERVLETGANTVSELALAGSAGGLWLARSERGADARARLLVQALDPATGKPRGGPELVRQSDADTIGPLALRATSSGGVLLWMEHTGAQDARAKLWLARLEPSGKLRGTPSQLTLGSGEPRAASAQCDARSCRVVLALREGAAERLDGVLWPAEGDPSLRALAYRQPAPAESADPLALTEQGLWYATRRDGRGVLRRLSIDWQ